MSTLRQCAIHGRRHKRRRSLVAALAGAPQRRGVILRMGVTTPRKPNSAKRGYVKLKMFISKKVIFAKIPGDGKSSIQEFCVVLVEGGSPPDTPGVNYTLVRGTEDFRAREPYGRMRRRSKFGTLLPTKEEQEAYRASRTSWVDSIKIKTREEKQIEKEIRNGRKMTAADYARIKAKWGEKDEQKKK